MEKRNIVESITEPSKQDIWLKDGKFLIFGDNGWSSITSSSSITEKPNEFNTLTITSNDIISDDGNINLEDADRHNAAYISFAIIHQDDNRVQDLDKIKYITFDNSFSSLLAEVTIPHIIDNMYSIHFNTYFSSSDIFVLLGNTVNGDIEIEICASSSTPSASVNLPIVLNEDQTTELVTNHIITISEQDIIQSNKNNTGIKTLILSIISTGCNKLYIDGQGLHIWVQDNGFYTENKKYNRLFSGKIKDSDLIVYDVLVTLTCNSEDNQISILIELIESTATNTIYAPDFKVLPIEEGDNETLDLTRMYNIIYNLGMKMSLPLMTSGIPTIYNNTEVIVVKSPIDGTSIRCIKSSDTAFIGESIADIGCMQKIIIIVNNGFIAASVECSPQYMVELSEEQENTLKTEGEVVITKQAETSVWGLSNGLILGSNTLNAVLYFSSQQSEDETDLLTTYLVYSGIVTINNTVGLLTVKLQNVTKPEITITIAFKPL